LWLWLNAGGDPAQIAARGGHSVTVLLAVYTHCIHGRDDILNQQIDTALRTTPPDPRRQPCPAPRGSRPGTCRSRGTRYMHGRAADLAPRPAGQSPCTTGPSRASAR